MAYVAGNAGRLDVGFAKKSGDLYHHHHRCSGIFQPFIIRIDTSREWAEVCFVPNAIGHSKNGSEYRYMATREKMQEQLHLLGMADEKEYPFQTMAMDMKKCKVFGIVSNMDWEG